MNVDEMIFSKKYLIGESARWAINQSPYYVPDNLEIVLRKFSDLLPTYTFDGGYGFKKMKKDEFSKWLFDIITQIPELVNWNNPKNGNNSQYLFTSRYDEPAPDSNFVDLHALVRNIKQSLIKLDE